MKLKLIYTSISRITPKQDEAILKFRKECFGNLESKEIEENFGPSHNARFGRVFAYLNKKIIGGTGLFKKSINYDGKTINLGGVGGVCVLPKYQRRGFGTQIVRYAMNILKKKGYDVAIITVDLEAKKYALYEKAGFQFLKQKVTFTNSKGKKLVEDATMVAPLNSREPFEFVIHNDKPFHWGKGIW